MNFRDQGSFGAQGGLLSEAECQHLFRVFNGRGSYVLEVGHYHGLSTYVLDQAGAKVCTIDGYMADEWVNGSTAREHFERNRLNLFPYVMCLDLDSRAIKNLSGFDALFYDGDHGEEQLRFTEMAIRSPDIELIVFDDRDFPYPAKCEEMLRDAGWFTDSPELYRHPRQDKAHPETMTLAVWAKV